MSGFIDALMLPFAFPFMQQAFIISVLIAAPMALLSCFLVLKGWSLYTKADTSKHQQELVGEQMCV